MYYRSRFALCCIALCAACTIAQGQPAQGQPVGGTVRPADLAKLIELARQNGMQVEYEQTTTDEGASGKGSSVEASGDAASVKHDASAPAVGLSKGTSATGGTSTDAADSSVHKTPWFRIILGVLGLAIAAGGIWKFVQKEYDTAIGQILTGATCALCAVFPALLYLLAVGVALSSLTHYLPDKIKSAYHAVIDGIGEAVKQKHPSVDTLLPFIKAQATPSDAQNIQTTAAANGNPINLS